MARPQMTYIWTWLLAALMAGGALAACGGGPEQGILNNYFRAIRFGDTTTLANIATARYGEGTIQSFSIVSVSEEQRSPLQVRQLTETLEAAIVAEQDFAAEKKVYQDENIEAIQRVLEAEQAGETLSGADGEVQVEWTRWRDEQSEYVGAVSAAREALNAARSVAEVSVFNAENPVNLVAYEGELLAKDVTIDAEVQVDGAVEERQLMVRLEKADLMNGPAERPVVAGRWIVSSIGPA